MLSFTLLALKIVGPALTKALVKRFNIPSDLQNELWGAAIDVVAGKTLTDSGAEKVTLNKAVDRVADQIVAEIRPQKQRTKRRPHPHHPPLHQCRQ